MNKKIQYGIIGAGHQGHFHAQQILNLKNVSLVGIYDIDVSKANELVKKYNIKKFDDLLDLLAKCEAVSICTPASTHYEVAVIALNNNCHLFIEKPITHNYDDACKINNLNKKLNKKIQVGHIERFNSAYKEFAYTNPKPLFIESHRLSPFGERGLDVPVVLDLMIHDIDLILSCVNSNVIDVHASGASVVSGLFDLANARIEFENGCVANITASRISNKQMRQMRVFEKNAYSVLDFQNQTFKKWVVKNKKNIQESVGLSRPVNALYEELKSFTESITSGLRVTVSDLDGYKALSVANCRM